jgi:glutamate racemase
LNIGVFDSGIGGITVLRAIQEAWPGHSTVYLGDTARVPYGSKSRQTVVRYARQIAHYLLGEGIDLLVVACNTASAYALDDLSDLSVPVLGVIEPGARAAALATRTGHIAVIGTAATVGSGAYPRAIVRRRPDARVSSRACPLFVPLADEGWESTPVARAVAERYLEPWLPGRPDRPDVLVLGCTHYPVLAPVLAEVMGPEVALIDSAHAVARELAPYLEHAPAEARPARRMIVTDGAPGFTAAAQRWLGVATPLETIDLTPLAPA